MADEDCPVGFLVDVSVPDPIEEFIKSKVVETENKENNHPENEPIEISRSDDSDRRLSITLEKPLVLDDRILKDVTKNSNAGGRVPCSPEIQLLDDETFDFDLPLSPGDQVRKDVGDVVEEEDDDEEVFFGPVGFTERIVAATVGEDEIKPLSPLNPSQIAEMVKEAHFVACRIAAMKSEGSSDDNNSPSKRKLFSPNGRSHTRKGTFRMEDEDIEKQPEKVRRSIPCIDFKTGSDNHETMDVQRVLPLDKQADNKSPESSSDKENNPNKENSDNQPKVENKDQKPSKLTRLKRTSSYTLIKTSSNENLETGVVAERARHKSSGSEASESSVASDGSDVPFTKPSTHLRRSLQQTLQPQATRGKVSRMSRLQAPGNQANGMKKGSSLAKPVTSALTVRNVQRASPAPNTQRGTRQRTHSNSSNSSVNSTTSSISNKSMSGIPNPSKVAAPMPKMQLMLPGKLQKTSLAFNKNKVTDVKKNGPMKAVAATPTADVQGNPGMSPAPSRAMRTRSTPVKPDKSVQPKKLSSSFTTPVKSGSTSSYGQSTPISERKDKRRSLLPTPSKSSTSSAPPPSPFSVRSSASSNNSFSSRKSLSLTSESPVFVMDKNMRKRIPSGSTKSMNGMEDNNASTLKPRRALVQHTPDIPKQAASRWSPLRRSRQLSADEQAMQCTKRQHRMPPK